MNYGILWWLLCGLFLHEADDGSRCILTVSDYFTKWVEAVPTTDKSASTVADVLFKVLYVYY